AFSPSSGPRIAPHPVRARIPSARTTLSPLKRGEGSECAAALLPAPPILFMNQRAGAVVGEQLEQHRVRHLAVEDDDAFDAVLDRINAGLDLGDHAAGNGAVGDQRMDV